MKNILILSLAIITIMFCSWINNPTKFSNLKNQSKQAFTNGEKLKFRIGLGFIDAGYAEFEVVPYKYNSAYYHVIGKGYSSKTVDWFFKIRDQYETIIDSSTLCPIQFIRSVEEGNAAFKQHYIFDHKKQKVFDGKDTISTCEKIQDMMSCYFYARNLELEKLKKGEILTFPTFVDSEIFNLKIKFLGKENIKIDAGNFKALKFCPVVQKGRVFENEESLTVWISDDYNKIPLLVKAKILVGSIKMELTEVNGNLNELGLDN